ncbi:hypothetical protein I7I53_06312 [Histoplasma capsulatum var. duboisii H88]|uniref:Uncharacterized protein n=1 Tax=Ajellomyces capsulatus (strain H88) TaxID=544711 RepID=A0A8A1LGH8_AJEC8|nr:hypothetical protein I7I53_06312 [Histoplasma capsulatum var. duboisii H88]
MFIIEPSPLAYRLLSSVLLEVTNLSSPLSLHQNTRKCCGVIGKKLADSIQLSNPTAKPI